MIENEMHQSHRKLVVKERGEKADRVKGRLFFETGCEFEHKLCSVLLLRIFDGREGSS